VTLRIDLSGECVHEVVINKHLVPHADEVHVDIVCNLQVTVYAEEVLERAIDKIMEGDGVKTVIGGVSRKH
jgi:hypothetical protein